MIICKECRCFYPVTVSDRYCGECCIGDTRNPIEINAEITGCCLFEPKQPKPLTNADRIRAMTDEELAEELTSLIINASYSRAIFYGKATEEQITVANLKWLKQEVIQDAGNYTYN